MKKLLLIGDSDMLIALLNKEDIHHRKTLQILHVLTQKDARIYFPTTTIVETITTMQRKLSNAALVSLVIEKLTSQQLSLLSVNQVIIEEAVKIFAPSGSKQNTFFDAVVAACAKKYHADAIFSFDKWYEKKGFTLASAL